MSKTKKMYERIVYHDIDDDLYSFGKAMTRSPKFQFRPRTDIILWYSAIFTDALTND